ncbi:NAD(P)-binding domain-containing protein, partial [Candidatus Bipolaricaulota bacterium]|nr:NAD(P)-binding domain-containing protein [Candidatus Bipolaricaulota bacterium]
MAYAERRSKLSGRSSDEVNSHDRGERCNAGRYRMTEQIGFVGLGIMGHAMARNLLKVGFDLMVWNRTASKAEDLVAAGAAMAKDLLTLAERSDVIVICVSDTPDAEAVLFGDDALF